MSDVTKSHDPTSASYKQQRFEHYYRTKSGNPVSISSHTAAGNAINTGRGGEGRNSGVQPANPSLIHQNSEAEYLIDPESSVGMLILKPTNQYSPMRQYSSQRAHSSK